MDLSSNDKGEYCIDCEDSQRLLSAVYGRSKILSGEDLGAVTTLFKTLGVAVTFDGEDRTPAEI